jgi:GNAT superfamily N-acetyltransferase
LFDEDGTTSEQPWTGHARAWFTQYVDDHRNARFPLIEMDGEVVATAIGTLEIGVPNPQCVRGRTVRLANVITLPEHRGQGHATMLVLDIVAWARSIAADRVDLSATPAGQGVYEKLGFVLTSAPRMKLVLLRRASWSANYASSDFQRLMTARSSCGAGHTCSRILGQSPRTASSAVARRWLWHGRCRIRRGGALAAVR